MNQQQATQIVQDVMAAWERGDENIERYYDPQMVGHYQDKLIDVAAVKNRMAYINVRYQRRKFHLGDIVLIDANTIVFRVRQTGFDVQFNKPYSTELVGVYKVENNLIKEIWLLSDITLDYYADTAELKAAKTPKENHTFDAVERKRFADKLADYRYFYRGKDIQLTPREQEVLYYFLKGYSAKEIAKIISLSNRTVEDYLAKIKGKYGCSTKHELRQKIFPAQPLG